MQKVCNNGHWDLQHVGLYTHSEASILYNHGCSLCPIFKTWGNHFISELWGGEEVKENNCRKRRKETSTVYSEVSYAQ